MDAKEKAEELSLDWIRWIRQRFVSTARSEFKNIEKKWPGAVGVFESALKTLGQIQLREVFHKYLDKVGGEIVWRDGRVVRIRRLKEAAKEFAKDSVAEYRRHLRT